MSKPRGRYVCRGCGDDRLRFGATVVWDMETQAVRVDVWGEGRPYCGGCEGRFHWAKFVDLDGNDVPPEDWP